MGEIFEIKKLVNLDGLNTFWTSAKAYIDSIKDLIGDENSGLTSRVGTLETIVGSNVENAESGLCKEVKDIKATVDALGEIEGGKGIGEMIDTKVSAVITSLDVEDTAVEGQYVSSVSETDGKITVNRTALPSLSDLGGITPTDVDTKVKEAIEALDVEDTAIDGQYVSSVSQEDGKITVTRVALPAQKEYSIASITGNELTNLGANVKEAYKLVVDGAQAGDTIKIYKDSSLKDVNLVSQELVFTYILADGTEKTESVDVSTFLAQSEFKNGLEVDTINGTVAVKIDATSEFLTVSENGVKVSGIQDAINTAKSVANSYTDAELAKITLATDDEIIALFNV